MAGGSQCRWIDMGELIDSGVGGKVDPWTNEDGPDFPLDASGQGQETKSDWSKMPYEASPPWKFQRVCVPTFRHRCPQFQRYTTVTVTCNSLYRECPRTTRRRISP
eukprot:g83142.t1